MIIQLKEKVCELLRLLGFLHKLVVKYVLIFNQVTTDKCSLLRLIPLHHISQCR